MNLNQLFATSLVVAVLALLAWTLLDVWRTQRHARRGLYRDPPLFVDQWTTEQRQRLAALNHPAPKGFAAQRKAEK